MFAGSVTGGIPGSGTDRSATGLATGQLAARGGDGGDVTACRAGGTVRCGARAWARWSVSPPARKTIVTTAAAAAAATTRARPLNKAQRLALAFSRRPGPLIAILTAALSPYPVRRCQPSFRQHLAP